MKRFLSMLFAALLALVSALGQAAPSHDPADDQFVGINFEALNYRLTHGDGTEDVLPWQQSNAPPDLLALSTTIRTSPNWVFFNPAMSFQASLQTTLVPEHSQGSGTPTFTRATTAYQIDFEGKLNLALSGESRFQGARRVRNYAVTTSEDFSNAIWNKGGTATITAGISDPLGGTTAYQLDLPADSDSLRNIVTMPAGSSQLYSIWMKADVAGTIRLVDGNNGTPDAEISVTPAWRRVSSGVGSPASGTRWFFIQRNGVGQLAKIYIWRALVEDVTGQANQNPSEYVSVGVLSAPYHGANVDGVKYFSTLNGNTVASNVVTEATGAAITSAAAEAAGGVTAGVVDAYGPLGYLAEGARTNSILQSNTLGTTWTISHADDMNAVAADAYVSVDGTTTMDKLQPKATTAVHSLDQAFTFTAAKYTTAVDLRYVPATPQRWVALILNDGTTTWGASFDLLNGVVGAVSAGATSGIEATALANVYRVWVTNTANAAAAAGTVKISLNATDTATLESAARAGTETLGAGFVQHEVGTFASSPITTTTVAVTRAGDVLTYPTASNFSDTAGTMAAGVGYVTWANATGSVIGSATQGMLPLATNSGVSGFDGTNTVQGTAGTPSGVVKMAVAWSGSTMTVAGAGTAAVTGSYDGAWNLSSIGIGTGCFCTVRNVGVWLSAFTGSQLTLQTAFNEAFMPYRVAWAEAANDDEYLIRANSR